MITNLADVLRILETDYKVLSVIDTVKVKVLLETDYKVLSVIDTVKVKVLFEEVEVPLDLWTQAIMINELKGEIA